MLVITWLLGVLAGVLGMVLAAHVVQRRRTRVAMPEGCIGRCPVCSTPVAVRFHPGTPEGTNVDVLFPTVDGAL